MAFKRKDVKKSSYYVWFLGAKESKGIRGDEYVMPVLHYLLDKEREFEPSKVTLQVSSKGLKIIQNVPKHKNFLPPIHHFPDRNLQSSMRMPSTGDIRSPSVQSSARSGSGQSDGRGAIKMEVIKHLIPSTAITCVAQEDDIVCVIMLLFNPITKCPIHIHAYRCDSVETATALKGQLNVLINRPENQKKFQEIEEKLRARSIAHAQMMKMNAKINHNNCPVNHGTTVNGSVNRRSDRYHGSDGITSPTSSASPQRSKEQRSSSDGRSIRTTESDDSFDSFPLRGVKHSSPVRGSAYPCGRCPSINEDNKLLKIKRSSSSSCHPSSSSGKLLPGSKSPSKSHPKLQHPDPLDTKAAIFESLAHELKVKLENKKKVGPILLPPRDYDTIHRTRGNLMGIDERKSTNKLLVGQVVDRSSITDKNMLRDRTQIISAKVESNVHDANDVNYQTRSESSGMSSGIGSDEAIPNLSKSDKGMVRSKSEKVIDRESRLHKTPNDSSEDEEEIDENLWLSSETRLLDIYGSHLDNEDIEPDYDQDDDEDQQPKYYYFPDPRFVAEESKVLKQQSSSSKTCSSQQQEQKIRKSGYFGVDYSSRLFPSPSSSSHLQPSSSSRNSYGH